MYCFGIFRDRSDRNRDVCGHVGKYRDIEHARQVMHDAISIHEVLADQVRGYYDWTDLHNGAARYCASPSATEDGYRL